MRIVQFVKKEIRHVLASPESLLLMVLFPFALTLVLGTALSGSFARVTAMPEIRLPAVIRGDVQSRIYLSQARSAGINLEQTGLDSAREQALSGKARGYVTVDGDGITYHAHSFSGVEALVLGTYSRLYAQQAQMARMAVGAARPDLAVQQPGEHVVTQGLDTSDEPTSFGYYGVTMLTMIMMYGAMQAMGLMSLERRQRTDLRLKASPFSMGRVYLAKSGMSVLTLLGQALILMALNALCFGVRYRSIPLVLAMLIPYALFCNGLGLFAWQAARSEQAAGGVINLLIVALVFLGGGYVPLENMPAGMAALADWTPVGKMNAGLFAYIYRNDSRALLEAMAMTGALAAALLAAAYALFRREEGSDRVAGV